MSATVGAGIAAVPVGYGLAVPGAPLFALAGLSDYLWHTVFGIEQSLNILFSPTHLLLGVSVILLVLLVPAEGRRGAFLAFGALAPLVTWSVYLAVASGWIGHPPAVVEYWTGIPVVTALLGLVLAVLMQPTGSARYPDRVAAGDVPGAVGDQVKADQRPHR